MVTERMHASGQSPSELGITVTGVPKRIAIMQQQVEPGIAIRLVRQRTEMRFRGVRTCQEVRDEITPGWRLRHF
jgi:hypothetical protein